MKSPSLPFTSVVSLHTNEYGCGVAKFSKQLAERLGKEWVGFEQPHRWGDFPLYSLKLSEFDTLDYMVPYEWFAKQCGVFWHDKGDYRITQQAKIVYYADPALGSPGLWCPSLIESKPRTVKLFTFGMAGRLQLKYFLDVRALLENAGLDYHLRVSSGLHEGTSLSDAMRGFESLKEAMGRDKVTFLGILSDEAVSEELRNADYVLAFFEHGARLNNTTLHAALDSMTPVISNLGTGAPERWQDRVTFIEHLAEWPVAKSPYTWEGLISEMTAIYARTEDRQSVNRG